ncbi:MAG TPA: heavy-metal-associated domain-containing protein [Candidatus Dormibacteraeota bacterium]
MSEITLTAPDISCDHCKRTIETELAGLDGIQRVEVQPPAKSVHVVFDGGVIDEPSIAAKLDDIGYPVA